MSSADRRHRVQRAEVVAVPLLRGHLHVLHANTPVVALLGGSVRTGPRRGQRFVPTPPPRHLPLPFSSARGPGAEAVRQARSGGGPGAELVVRAARGGAALALVAGAVDRGNVWVLGGAGQADDAQLADLHAGPEFYG